MQKRGVKVSTVGSINNLLTIVSSYGETVKDGVRDQLSGIYDGQIQPLIASTITSWNNKIPTILKSADVENNFFQKQVKPRIKAGVGCVVTSFVYAQLKTYLLYTRLADIMIQVLFFKPANNDDVRTSSENTLPESDRRVREVVCDVMDILAMNSMIYLLGWVGFGAVVFGKTNPVGTKFTELLSKMEGVLWGGLGTWIFYSFFTKKSEHDERILEDALKRRGSLTGLFSELYSDIKPQLESENS
jgi:hypothetical protein